MTTKKISKQVNSKNISNGPYFDLCISKFYKYKLLSGKNSYIVYRILLSVSSLEGDVNAFQIKFNRRLEFKYRVMSLYVTLLLGVDLNLTVGHGFMLLLVFDFDLFLKHPVVLTLCFPGFFTNCSLPDLLWRPLWAWWATCKSSTVILKPHYLRPY